VSNNQTESKIHQSCYKFLHNNYPDLRKVVWHTRNEGDYSQYEQSIIKSLGITKGVADLVMLYGGNFYGIEIKAPGQNPRPSQTKWGTAIEKQGGEYHVIRSLDEFKSLIKDIVGEPDGHRKSKEEE